MKLQFKEQQFQIEAVNAITNCFLGQQKGVNHFTLFDIENEKLFDSLIEFNLNTNNNVVDIYNNLKKNDIKNIIPFGEDGFGNYICFQYENLNQDNPNVVFFNHENHKLKYIADNFNEFLNILY